MRCRLRVVAAGVVLTAPLVLVGPGTVVAQEPPPTHGELIEGGAQANAGYHDFDSGSGQTEVAPQGSNTDRECWIERDGFGRVELAGLQAAYDLLQGGGKLPVTYVCQDRDGTNRVPTPGQWPPDDNDDFIISPEELRDSALNRLWFPPPQGTMIPSLEVGTKAQLLTYFAVSNFAPVSASATAGPVTATVTAEPTGQDWTIIDSAHGNSSFSCNGPGVAIDPAAAAAAGSTPPPGACTWTFPHSSAGQPPHPSQGTGPDCAAGNFYAEVTITWNVSWDAEGAPGGGPLGTGQSAASTCIFVDEIQALVTADG